MNVSFCFTLFVKILYYYAEKDESSQISYFLGTFCYSLVFRMQALNVLAAPIPNTTKEMPQRTSRRSGAALQDISNQIGGKPEINGGVNKSNALAKKVFFSFSKSIILKRLIFEFQGPSISKSATDENKLNIIKPVIGNKVLISTSSSR